MSFSDRREDDGDGRGVERKYIPRVTGAETLSLDVANRCRFHPVDLIFSLTDSKGKRFTPFCVGSQTSVP